MSELVTPTLPIDLIDIEDGFNPRTDINRADLERLASSIRRNELIQPVAVRPGKDGRYILVAGGRRFAAARLAGLKEVPVTLRKKGNARAAALAENLHREGLNPIDTANGIKQLAEEMGLSTHKEIAAELHFSTAWVSQHLRLLKLPDGVQAFIARGEVPLEAERPLRRIAAVSSRTAECICELAVRESVKPSHFLDQLGRLLESVPTNRFTDPPTLISARRGLLSEIVADEKKRQELGDRYLAARPLLHTTDPNIAFSDAEIDAARAAGCLIEHEVDHGEWVGVVRFITDAALACDLVERQIEKAEKKAAAEREEREKAAKKAGSSASKTAGDGEPAPSPYQQRKAKREKARRWNQDLGHKILARKKGASEARNLNRVKALILGSVADHRDLPARGLRLVLTQLQEVEHKQLKTSSESREKVTYATSEQALEWFSNRIRASTTIDEALRIWTDAVLAAHLANEDELPLSMQVGDRDGLLEEPERLLAADLKAVGPKTNRSEAKS